MRILYNTCFTDPWIKVAQKLRDNHGFEPVYWIGYEDDDSKTLVPRAFPECIYQDYFDAFKGNFPPAIESHYGTTFFDIDFLKEYASFELQAIKMMDRMDSDRYSFNFMERQRHFRNMVKYCAATLDQMKIDAVICDIVPHRVFDYVFNLLCRHRNIPFITFRATSFKGRIMTITDISTIGSIPEEDYQGLYRSAQETALLKKSMEPDILRGYEKILQDYSKAEPEYMKQHVIMHKRGSGFFPLVKKFFLDLDEYSDKYFGEDGFLKRGMPTYSKKRNESLEKTRISLYGYSKRKLSTTRYKNRLKKYYDSLVVNPDLTVPYVIFPLHYQPEMTTCPCGDIFVDQRLCIDVLAKQLPPGWMIYVKEHRAQFYSHAEGHAGRIPEFYRDLLSYPQVRLIDADTDQFDLIRNSRAIATVTGTSGWEGMVLGKPVIIFGLSWYEKYSGVLKVQDESSASKITDFIENFRFDERDLFCYLHAIAKKTKISYAEREIKKQIDQPEEECIANIIALVTGVTDHINR